MSAYVPEFVYGFTGWDKYCQPTHGLVEWPAHLQPRLEHSDIALTKKGEAYVAAALANADGVIFLTLDTKDRTTLSTTIERLINLLDSLDGEVDAELTAPESNGRGFVGWEPDDSEDGGDTERNGDEGDYDGGESDPPGFIWGGNEGGRCSRPDVAPLMRTAMVPPDGVTAERYSAEGMLLKSCLIRPL